MSYNQSTTINSKREKTQDKTFAFFVIIPETNLMKEEVWSMVDMLYRIVLVICICSSYGSDINIIIVFF